MVDLCFVRAVLFAVFLAPVIHGLQDPAPSELRKALARDLLVPPNILILVADDVGVDTVGAYAVGTDLPPTPTIDSLAARGLLFRKAVSYPWCSPSRAAIQTGRYGFRTGIGHLVAQTGHTAALPLSEITLPELLDLKPGRSYATAAIGKWHLGNGSVGGNSSPNWAGYSHFSGTMGNISNYYSWPKVVDGVSSVSTTYATTDTVDSALQWITNTREPWLCYVSFNAAHTPYHAPPPNLHTQDLSQPTNRLFYKAMVEALDTEMGRLLDGIPADVFTNTMIFFVGDNGTQQEITVPPFLPNHGKSTLYEGGTNVPFLVAGPLVRRPGTEVRALVDLTDLFATVGDIAGVRWSRFPAGVTLDSVSLAPYFRDPTRPSLRSFAYAEIFQPNGVGNPPLPAPCPPLPVCQEDAGFAGPGSALLTVCGEELYGGYLDTNQFATLLVQNAPPNSVGSLYISDQYNPTPMFGGTVVPWPTTQITAIQTDASGSYSQAIKPSPAPITLYQQALIMDQSVPGGVSISNAVAVKTKRTDMQAIRDARYKLIVNNPKCQEVFHDLVSDPFEQTNLLPLGLTPIEMNRYLALKAQLAQLRP